MLVTNKDCKPAYEPISFAELSAWPDDDHDAALAAFVKSVDVLRCSYPGIPGPGGMNARSYFEAYFVPHRIVRDGAPGFFTGYFEPVLKGSRVWSERFSIPLLRKPDNLETLVDDSLRASSGGAPTHALRMPDGNLEACATRREIEQGCLASSDLEILYLQDRVDAFFLQVQGSGVIEVDGRERVRVSYAAKNGHPYTSIGQILISEGVFTKAQLSLQSLSDWLRADAKRGRQMMWRNQSYIFFEELGDAEVVPQQGVKGIALTEGRSLAVDASVHAIGLPIFVNLSAGADLDFNRLLVAQDVGSAIRGVERGDIFFGTGPQAGCMAGTTKHEGTMTVLFPRPLGAS